MCDSTLIAVIKLDRVFATIVLSVEPALLYLLGEPNKLALRRKLYSLRLKERCSIQQHIKEIT